MITPSSTAHIPHHIAIIMDGNGRWAQKRGLSRSDGHKEGVESVWVILRACKKAGVKYLTLYAFSTENWSRPKSEISALMKLLSDFLGHHERDLHKEQIRLRVIGNPTAFPRIIRTKLNMVMKATEKYKNSQLILALNYGGRDELTRAARKIAGRVAAGELKLSDIDEAVVAAHLDAPDVPDPELMIRTSGEMRISNFLLWQLSYSELYITDVLWPDFREEDFFKALAAYSQRQRRFGDIK
jgi:undecaprenyl diphosphate synthase